MNDQLFADMDCWDMENPCGVCRWCHPDYCGLCDRVGCNEIGGHPPPPPPSVMPEEGVRVILFCLFSFVQHSLFRRTPFACGASPRHARRRPRPWLRSRASLSLASPVWWPATSANPVPIAGLAASTPTVTALKGKPFTTDGALHLTPSAIFDFIGK